MKGETCLQCCFPFNTTNRRKIITPSCEHEKCIICVTTEEGNCSQCLQISTSQSLTIDENLDPTKVNSAAVESTSTETTLDSEELAVRFQLKKCTVSLIRLSLAAVKKLSLPSAGHSSSALASPSKLTNVDSIDFSHLNGKRRGTVRKRLYNGSTSSTLSPVNKSDKTPLGNGSSGNEGKIKRKRNRFVKPDHITILEGTPPIYQCTICNKAFRSKSHCKYHIFCRKNEKLKFKCEYAQCGKGFKTKAHYDYHIKTHTGENPFNCNVCNRSFKVMAALTRHKRSHTGEKPFACQECGSRFTNSQTWKTHILRHSGGKPFACTSCDRRFFAKRHLQKHILTHTGERPHICDQCGKSFSLKGALALHITTHSNVKSYACEYCPKMFTSSRLLRRHIVCHVGKNRFKCTHCEAAFKRKDNLERHMSTIHFFVVKTVKAKRKYTRRKNKSAAVGNGNDDCDTSQLSPAPPELLVESENLLTDAEDSNENPMPTLDPEELEFPALASSAAPNIVSHYPQIEGELTVTRHIEEDVPIDTRTTSQQTATGINDIAVHSDCNITNKQLESSLPEAEPKENHTVSEMSSDLAATDNSCFNQLSPPSPEKPEVDEAVVPVSSMSEGITSEGSQSYIENPGVILFTGQHFPQEANGTTTVIIVDGNGSLGYNIPSEEFNNINENCQQVPLEKGDDGVYASPPAKRRLLCLNFPVRTSPDVSMETFEHLLEDKDDWQRPNQNGDTILHKSARLGNFEALHFFISLGADVNAKNKQEETPLHHVRFAKENFYESIKVLLEDGADINAQDVNGNTVLLLLAESGRVKVELALLVECGCDWKRRRKNGESILHVSAAAGNIDALKYFISLGANLNARDKNHNAPVHSAALAKQNFTETLKILVDHGADIRASNNVGNTVLYVAIGSRRSPGDLEQFFEQVLTICPSLLNTKNIHGFSSMHAAAETGNIPALKYFISRGADIHSRCNQQRTPLHHAMFQKEHFRETVDILLENEADINAVDSQGNNIVFFAAYLRRDKEELEYIVSRGGDWRVRNKLGNSILHLVANSGYPEAVGYFISKGMHANCISSVQDTTPLHQVAFTQRNFAETLKILIEKQAEINAMDKDGNNVVFLATLTGRSVEDLELLVKYGCDWRTKNRNGQSVLHLAAQSSSLTVLNYWISKGADVNSRSNDGRTPFHQLIFGNAMFSEKLKLFLDAGADIRAVDNDGLNVVQMAVYFGKDRNVLEPLVRRGANWRAKRKDGYGVLHLAAERGNLEAVKYFISLRADVNASSNPGDTPLHRVVYAKENFTEILTLLHKNNANINAVDDDGNNVLFLAARAGRLQVEMEDILELGGDWTVINNEGESILHGAARAGNVKALKLFMAKGANVNWRSTSGKMPIHCAVDAQQNFPRVIDMLTDGGVDINAVDSEGNNVLMLAALKGRSKEELEHVVNLGGDWKAKNKSGQSILHLSVEGKNLEAVGYFLSIADWKANMG